jgi:glycosyltransferase involved in cell wall biosynthesis
MKTVGPVRILYVEGNIDGTLGGSFFSLLFLVSGLDRSRFEPVVVFAADNALRPRFHAAGITTLVRPVPRPAILNAPGGRLIAKGLNFLRGWIVEPLRLARLLRRERIDLLHLNNSITRNHTWTLGALFARIPCITHERGINERFKPRDLMLGRRMKSVICISAAVRDNFFARGVRDLPLVTIHNGLDPAQMRVTRDPGEIRAELGVPAEARLIGIVGNIKPWKGQEVVIQAMTKLQHEFPDVVCLLIGDTSPNDMTYRQRMHALIEELGLGRRVLITGFKQDIANYVNVLEIQIHASVLPEPFGRVLLEAMALEKPVIASGDGAVPEILVDGVTGYLFPPNDADALAARLRGLLGDREAVTAMGRAGRQRLEAEFSITRNLAQTQQLYDRLLSR